MSAVDIALIACLVVVLVHNMILSRRVSRLMAALREIGPAIESFSSAVDRSEASVSELSLASARVSAAVAEEGRSDRAPEAARKPQSGADRMSAAITNFYASTRARSRA